VKGRKILAFHTFPHGRMVAHAGYNVIFYPTDVKGIARFSVRKILTRLPHRLTAHPVRFQRVSQHKVAFDLS